DSPGGLPPHFKCLPYCSGWLVLRLRLQTAEAAPEKRLRKGRAFLQWRRMSACNSNLQDSAEFILRTTSGGIMKRLAYFVAAAFCLFLVNGAALAQAEDDVVVNEFSVNPATGKEYVELLVTKPGGINMQGWTLSDVGTRAGATAATEG